MSDPTNPATPDGNTADPSTTTIDWESPDNPYAQRYRDAQSHLTPLQQENARLKALEEDPSAFLELGKTKGWVEFDEPAPGPQEQDPYADIRQQNQELMAWKQQTEAEKQAQETREQFQTFIGLVNKDLDEWSKEAGVTLSNATRRGMVEMFMEDPEAANDDEAALRRIFDAEVKNAPRQRPRAPHVPTSGQSGTDAPDWSQMTPGEINRYMVERVRAHESQT